ncbi:MAG TPA: serine/threonine-protein kinase [Streptosporangiaceae bacterium]|nr:serine/threonine-protein kinase [Streptosporangiaceae bacterium]
MTGIAGDHRPGTGAAPERRPQDPRLVGPYLIVGRLGSGGMGQVFLGRSPGGRLVAVKVVRAELAEQAEFRSRFAREVAAARKVSGLFTAPVVDADVGAPTPWLATAYVAGPSLADTVASHGPLPASSVLALAAGLAEGLGAIHAAGIVHRDLKPSNVLLAEDGPRIIDFGISLAAEATILTSTGVVFGAPSFMSPEQARGNRVGPPSDMFSLGAVLAFAATGQGPFGSGSGPTLMYRVVFTPPDVSGLPADIRPLVERCLAKDPEQRPTTQQFLAELSTAFPQPGWLPGPVTRTFPAYPPAEGRPGRADDCL